MAETRNRTCEAGSSFLVGISDLLVSDSINSCYEPLCDMMVPRVMRFMTLVWAPWLAGEIYYELVGAYLFLSGSLTIPRSGCYEIYHEYWKTMWGEKTNLKQTRKTSTVTV